jgi:hypothetical protein
LAYLVPLDVDVVPSRLINFCYDHFCVFHFFSILAVSMATAAILKTNFAAVAMETKKGDFLLLLISLIKLHEAL